MCDPIYRLEESLDVTLGDDAWQLMFNGSLPLPIAGECHQVALGGSRMVRGVEDLAHTR